LIDYWSMESLNYTPLYHEMFSRNRFELLYSSMLHASGGEEDEKSKKDKIEPFLNTLLKNFQAAFYPWEDLSIDEMVVKWKGRSKYKMYNPNKPEKYHIKTFGLCDSITGYAYNLLTYFGKETSYKEGLEDNQRKCLSICYVPLAMVIMCLRTGTTLLIDSLITLPLRRLISREL